MKYGALFLRETSMELWIFHAQAKKIFKKDIGNLSENLDWLQHIPAHLPIWCVLDEAALQFERQTINGLANLSHADKKMLAQTHLAKSFPRALCTHFATQENTLLLAGVLPNAFYEFVLNHLKDKKILLGTTCAAFFLPKMVKKSNEPILYIQKENDLLEWIVQDNRLIFGRKNHHWIDSSAFFQDEKEKIRRYLNLPQLQMDSINLNNDFFHAFILKNIHHDFSFFAPQTKLKYYFAKLLPFIENTIFVAAFSIIVYCFFLIQNIFNQNEEIQNLKQHFPESISILKQAEFWENAQKIAPFFLENYDETDLFWQAKDAQHFEIFLPSTVENTNFARFSVVKKNNGLLISNPEKNRP